MLRIIDRYVLRAVIPPFFIALFIFTFLLMIPPIMEVAEELISKGVDAMTILQLMATLIPQGLGITIPISLLLGILIGLGRLSSDRETVALQACGVSLYRILVPLALLGTVAAAATAYVLITVLPDANQAFREITFRTVANRTESDIKPRVFDEYFPGVVLYVREVSTTGGGWSDVLLADSRSSEQPNIYVAEHGRVIIDREEQRVDIVLTKGSGHQVDPSRPETYEIHNFDEIVIGLNADTVFRRADLQRGYRELSLAELGDEADRLTAAGNSPHNPIMEIHRRFSIPVACLVFTLIALGLGVTSRKDGKLGNFALGAGVIFSYYIIMYGAESMTKGAMVSPQLAMWLPNILLGLLGVGLVIWRSVSVERPVLLPFLRRRVSPTSNEAPEKEQRISLKFVGSTSRRLGLLKLNLLDWYVTRIYLGIAALAFIGLLGIFYISTVVDLSDKLFKGETTSIRLLEYLFFSTPQFSYYVLPIAALVATLVTVGLLTRNSELTVMKACGISLYRAMLPIIAISLVWSGVLFGIGESILASANREARILNQEIRFGLRPSTADVMNRRWIVGRDGSIYHYLSFEPELDEFGSLSIYEFQGDPWSLLRRTFAEQATFAEEQGTWNAQKVWARDLISSTVDESVLTRTDAKPLTFIEPPDYFETEPPNAELMNVRDLGAYVDELRDSGFNVVRLVVALHRKISFPFVTLVLTLIAVPFAVTMGPRGALYGVGVGISLACTYWVVMSVFGAIGSAGMLAPMLAAWAPNLLFGASATYLLLTVRT
jgi:LPS export ABC transporter permease LptF/LPS export ABC transporter permease LptG